jgi:hypothetical protein
MRIARSPSRAVSMSSTTGNACVAATKHATTKEGTRNTMNAKKFKSSLRLIAVILIGFLAAVSIVEVLIHLA